MFTKVKIYQKIQRQNLLLKYFINIFPFMRPLPV